MRKLQTISYVGIALASAAAITFSPITANAQPAIQAMSPESIVQSGATSVQMQSMQNGAVVNMNAGALDNQGTPIGDQAYFRAGSVTKPFISTVIMQLVDEGKVDLNAPIDTYLPGKIIGGDKITTKQLLSHTSGLQEYLPSLPLYNVASYPTTDDKFKEMLDSAYNVDQLIGYINSRPLATEPGSAFSYANSNYVVAGEIIAKVTNKPYAKNVEERVLSPLGMTHTYLPGTDQNLPNPGARGYTDISDPLLGGTGFHDMSRYNGSQVGASGEIISTTGDLNRFTKALASGTLVSADSHEQMITPISDMGDGSTGYGLGVMSVQTACGSMIGHGGNIYGYATQAFSSSDGSRQIAVSGTEGSLGYLQVTAATQQLAAQAMCE
ncbi:class A beta-lactamase-related serine hydrolase [bacterium]|nr:MAG: class A beta-lactamase-related serine hydrolase [bacterium]